MSRRDNSAVSNTKVEKSQEIVNVLCSKKVWNLHCQIEPSWDTDLSISAWNTSIWWNIFLDLHMHLVCVRVKIKHHRLLSKSVLVMDLSSNLIQVLVNRLLDVEDR